MKSYASQTIDVANHMRCKCSAHYMTAYCLTMGKHTHDYISRHACWAGSCNISVNITALISWESMHMVLLFNTLRPRRNGRLFADDIFKCIFLNENIRISIKISLKFVPKGLISKIPALVLIMAWRRPGDKPLWLDHWLIYASLGLNELIIRA